MLDPAPGRRWITARTLVAAALVVYLLFARTRQITETFVLLGDQILYWRMALGPWSELPLVGPSSVGGTTLGPIFIWIVWLSRVLIGPFADNLPHAGGIGIALVQSAADALLLIALWKRTSSASLALAVTLLVATGPLDLALSATIWNPPVSVAFVKATIALILLEGESRSPWWGLAATATSMLAVQAHSSAIFVAAPAIASFTVRELLARRWSEALRRGRATIEVVLIVELPYLLNLVINRPEQVAPTRVVEGVAASLGGAAGLRLRESFQAFASSTSSILFSPASFRWFGGLLLISLGVAAFRLRRDVTLLSATIAPIMFAIAGFATWHLSFDTYWFLTLAPSVALTIALALTAWRPSAHIVAAAMLAGIVLAQPARLAASMASHRVPEYGALLRGTRHIRQRTAEIRAIRTEFLLPPTADREFMYTILGGRVTPDAEFVATVQSSGEVVFTPAPD